MIIHVYETNINPAQNLPEWNPRLDNFHRTLEPGLPHFNSNVKKHQVQTSQNSFCGFIICIWVVKAELQSTGNSVYFSKHAAN